MNENQSIMRAVAEAWLNARRRIALARRRSREDGERARAQIALILDDMKAEGHDLSTPLGRAMFAEIVSRRAGLRTGPKAGLDEFPEGW